MAKEMIPLYDAMVRLFVSCMSESKISVRILANILDIPHGTMPRVLKVCPLPFNAVVSRGGHRGLEWFISQLAHPNSMYGTENVHRARHDILNEPVWGEYKLNISKDPNQIVAEVSKVLHNVRTLEKDRNTTRKIGIIIKKGDPAAYRCMWFTSDPINGAFFSTVHEALCQTKTATKVAVPRAKSPKEETVRAMPKLIPVQHPQEDIVFTFIKGVQQLKEERDHAFGTVKKLERQINEEYPGLIAQKEREKADAERRAIKLEARVKILESVNSEYLEEIKQLKRHPKWSGFVRKEAKK